MKLKQWLCLLLAVLMLFSVTACGIFIDDPHDSTEYTFPTVPETQEPTSPETSAPETEAPETEAPETQAPETEAPETEAPETEPAIAEDGVYDDKDSVALYIHLYGHLPANYITKRDAEKLGWPGGSLEPYAPGKCIGGSHFGNYEGRLPDAPGRSYTECDIDTMGARSRGAKRIIFSNDGLIYYTSDHYETFELLYGGN